MHAHTERKHTHSVNKVSVVRASRDTNKSTVNRESALAVTQRGLCLSVFGINRQQRKVISEVSTCVSTACKGTEHTLTHTHTATAKTDWPTRCSCRKTWQVEIGKWDAHFSQPSAEQKIGAFFLFFFIPLELSGKSCIKRWSEGVRVAG